MPKEINLKMNNLLLKIKNKKVNDNIFFINIDFIFFKE